MNIVCGSCSAKYTIAEDKVRGRKVKIRCKSCGTPIVVDGQGASEADAATDVDSLLDVTENPSTWSVNLSDTDSRTMSVEEIVAGWKSGLVTNDAFVWKDGMGDWVPVLESELAPLLGKSPSVPPGPPPPSPLAQPAPVAVAVPAAAPLPGAPPAAGRGTIPLFMAPKGTPGLAAAAAAQPAARAAAAREQGAQDLFGAIDTAGSEEDAAPTGTPLAPPVAGAAPDAGQLTGARNENSVLFSLDSLKAGFSGASAPPAGGGRAAPPAPKGKGSGPNRPQQISNPDDPFGMGSGGGIAGMGVGGFNLADNQALLTAPAPPPPPPPVAFDPSGAPLAPPASKTKLGILIGAGVGVLVLVLVLGMSLGKKKSAAEAIASAHASAEAVKAEGKPAESAAAPATAEAKPESSAPEAASAAPSASAASDKPAAVAAVAKPGDVKKPKEEPPPAAATDAPFSKASAISALGAASSGAASCKKPGGPTGTGKATVTFAPSGRVTTATVSGGSFAGTPVGGCVAGIFRKAKVPAFGGSPVTVSKSFTIN